LAEKKKSKKGVAIFLTLFFGIFFAIGLGVLIFAYKSYSLGKESLEWPSVEGDVVYSEIEKRTRTRSKGGSSTTFSANIIYEYTVEGETYTGDKLRFLLWNSSDRSESRSTVDKYPVGKVVPVYYKPDSPDTSVLEPGTATTFHLLLSFGFGAVFMVAGLFCPVIVLLVFLHKRRKAKAAIEEQAQSDNLYATDSLSQQSIYDQGESD